jgi:hypothetical protein
LVALVISFAWDGLLVSLVEKELKKTLNPKLNPRRLFEQLPRWELHPQGVFMYFLLALNKDVSSYRPCTLALFFM